MADRQESQKTEQLLGINNFNKPAEVSGVQAWANLISNLLFLVPGTYPTDPEMGCNIQQYQFSFVDQSKELIESSIRDQCGKYLPEIPLESVTITNEKLPSGNYALLIVLAFTMESDDNVAVIAAEKNNNIINFDLVV